MNEGVIFCGENENSGLAPMSGVRRQNKDAGSGKYRAGEFSAVLSEMPLRMHDHLSQRKN